MDFERVPPSAEEFFRMFEVCTREVFRWDNEKSLRTLVHVFTKDGGMRARIVPSEHEAHQMIAAALKHEQVAGASIMHETPTHHEGVYYSRESPPRVIRIPIIGIGADRRLGETVRDAPLH